MRLATITRLLTLAIWLMALAAGAAQAQKAVGPEAAAFKEIKVSFQVDPRVTRGMYMGEHWISPPTYLRIGESKTVIVPVQAFGLDAQKRETKIAPQWKSSNPSVVRVSPIQGHKVEITVLKAGQSDLTATYGKLSKKLVIKSTPLAETMRVEIYQ
ncbi:MAG: hypothetical protein PHU44_16755 [Syntrophales bacterium]|nr:hypothetical protein [Syntrophales bacterium]